MEGEQREDDKALRDIAEFHRKPVGKRKLAVRGLVSAIHNEVRQKHRCQANPQTFESGRKPPLDSRQNGRKKRNRAEDEKVRRPKKLKIGWHLDCKLIKV
jgi:hypothetical protein